jgi:hypothetical protein
MRAYGCIMCVLSVYVCKLCVYVDVCVGKLYVYVCKLCMYVYVCVRCACVCNACMCV